LLFCDLHEISRSAIADMATLHSATAVHLLLKKIGCCWLIAHGRTGFELRRNHVEFLATTGFESDFESGGINCV
jgi:hypothetical protein